jgi:hypothetical protein
MGFETSNGRPRCPGPQSHGFRRRGVRFSLGGRRCLGGAREAAVPVAPLSAPEAQPALVETHAPSQFSVAAMFEEAPVEAKRVRVEPSAHRPPRLLWSTPESAYHLRQRALGAALQAPEECGTQLYPAIHAIVCLPADPRQCLIMGIVICNVSKREKQ